MKKNYTTPSLKVDFFHTEPILHASTVAPTNAEFAEEKLQGNMDDTGRNQLGIYYIDLE